MPSRRKVIEHAPPLKHQLPKRDDYRLLSACGIHGLIDHYPVVFATTKLNDVNCRNCLRVLKKNGVVY